jgi:hypothetical protein
MADNRIRIEVYGVAEAIKELRNLEPDLYRNLIKDLKQSAAPLAKAVGLEFPEMPLLNWGGDGSRQGGRARFPSYNANTARRGVKTAVSTRQPRNKNEHGILRIQQMDAAGAIYDSAGSKTAASASTAGGKFIMNIDKGPRTKSSVGKTRSRVMYSATRKHLPRLIPAIEFSVRRTEASVQNTINKGIL